ncbi:MAG TPA: ATP-binding protein [Polyangiaceae bacterium]|nr:ATP-binding protein [Polyangiaceae bacterium]
MSSLTLGEREAFEADRLRGMRIRLAAMTILTILIWGSQALLYEDMIFPDRAYAVPYRLAELADCIGLVFLVSRRRTMRDLEIGGAVLITALIPIHGLAMLVVHKECVVPFLLTMEWSQPVVALAMLFSFRPACALFSTTWVVGVAVTLLRPGFDADLTDHAILALIYAVVAASIRNHDRLRVREFEARRDLQAANGALRSADEARSRLFTNLSHDLRTPLALITGEARALSRTATDEARVALARIERHSRDVCELADELLDAAKLDAGRLLPEPLPVDLTALASRVTAQFSGGSFAGKVIRAGDAPNEVVTAKVDPGHLRRIVWNLMGNATRQLGLGATHVELRTSRDGAFVVLDVANDGPSIPEDRRERIFERFASFDRAGGVRSGIGLPIARELAELNGGSLTLLPGERTVFRLRLPGSSDPPADFGPEPMDPSPEAPASSGERTSGHRTVLVVEDHAELRELVIRLLAPRFSVVGAATVAEAKRILETGAPDGVLSDLMLPDGTGRDVLSFVRRRPELAEVPVVLLSAVADEAERVAALAAGAADYVVKPFGPDELLARVEAACARSAERRRALDEQREDFLSELHDGVNAALARAALLLSAAERDGATDSRQSEIVRRAGSAVREALEEARTIVLAQKERHVPWSAAALELEAALRETAAGFGRAIATRERSDDSVHSLSAAEHHALRRLAAEAVTNAVRHGSAALDAELAAEAGEVRFRIVSARGEPADGVPAGTGFGLRAARRRFERLGGVLDVKSLADGSFRVEARFLSGGRALSPAA